jgi:hypothetical protein
MATLRSKGDFMPATPTHPSCKALLLCDQILVEAVTGRTSLIGIMDQVLVEEFPARFPRCQAFLQFTDALGEYNIVAEIHDLMDNGIVGRIAELSLVIQNPLARINLILPVPQIEILHSGDYDVIVLANKQELDRQTIQLRETDASGFEPERE